MAFRDETEALRQRVGMLQAELETERERLQETQAELGEQERMKARIAELERELAKLRPPPKVDPPKPIGRPPAKSQPWKTAFWVAGAIGCAVFFAYLDDCGPFEDAIEMEGAPTLQTIDLGRDIGPIAVSVDGDMSVEAFNDQSCRGYVPSRPLLVLRASEPMSVAIGARSPTDSVLVLRTASGEIVCDDDSGGDRNPFITTSLGPGEHRLWLGTYSEGESAEGTLTVTRSAMQPNIAAIDPSATPIIDTVEGADAVLSGRATGTIPAASLGCPGHLEVAPHALLRVTEPRRVRLTTTTSSGIDLVMLLRTEDGTVYCDDDGAGSYMPLVEVDLPAGDHRVWVGTLVEGLSSDFQLRVENVVAAAAPVPGSVTLGDETIEHGGRVEGTIPASQHGRCTGSMEEDPELVLTLEEARHVEIDLEGEAQEIVHGLPDGRTICARGDLSFDWTAGEHRIWIAAVGPASYQLTIRSTALN